MCSERTRARLEDIIDNVDRVASYIGSMTFAAYVEDDRTMDAVERCLERIAEAVVQIGEAEAERLGLGVPWRKVKGLGNKLRHDIGASTRAISSILRRTTCRRFAKPPWPR